METNEKSIAYFPVKADDEDPVNEVFRRLNIGGVELTEVELVLGEIKKLPRGLTGVGPDYEELVDVLWNLQPIPDGINNYKRTRDPKEFFNSSDGAKYWEEYDFIPERDSAIWDDPARFIQYRERQMGQALRERYHLELERVEPGS